MMKEAQQTDKQRMDALQKRNIELEERLNVLQKENESNQQYIQSLEEDLEDKESKIQREITASKVMEESWHQVELAGDCEPR